MDHIHQPTVLVINRGWIPIHVKTPAEAFVMMATDVAVALDIDGTNMVPTKWEDWLKLPVRPQDDAVMTVRGPVRAPRVVVLAKFAKVPMRRPKLSMKSIRQRDKSRCQYTGELLAPGDGSLDHVIPRSRGGKDTWENLVLAKKEVNHKKGNKLPHEAGLKLARQPKAMPPVPASVLIKNPGIGEWEHFLPNQS